MKIRLPSLLPALSLLLAGSGCKHAAPPFYPIGVYGVRSTNDLALLKQTGFNVVAGPARADFLQAAQAQGLQVLASPGTSAGPAFNAATARTTVGKFDGNPALWSAPTMSVKPNPSSKACIRTSPPRSSFTKVPRPCTTPTSRTSP